MDNETNLHVTKIKKLAKESSISILSSYTIFSPVSAIKELIDNALDAHSTLIEIQVDRETFGLNYISMKDNGSGIAKEDRELLCLKNTTSKISDLDDISILMPSLGFRGEALHYLATLSSSKNHKNGFNSMTITTKTISDKVGEKWSVNHEGEIVTNSIKHVSSTVGTSIVILGLFDNFPVRKKILIKKKQVTLSSIRQLIIDYAFINLQQVKFQLKFVNLNSKNELVKLNNNANNLDLTINSTLSYSQFLNCLTSIRNCDSQFAILENIKFHSDEWNMTCLLPIMKMENSITTFKKSIRTIVINSRPMDIRFGIGKEICKRVVSSYQINQLLVPSIFFIHITFCGNVENSNSIADINIEPEKNNILLNDQATILSDIFECLSKIVFDNHYSHDIHNISQEVVEKEKEGSQIVEILENNISEQHNSITEINSDYNGSKVLVTKNDTSVARESRLIVIPDHTDSTGAFSQSNEEENEDNDNNSGIDDRNDNDIDGGNDIDNDDSANDNNDDSYTDNDIDNDNNGIDNDNDYNLLSFSSHNNSNLATLVDHKDSDAQVNKASTFCEEIAAPNTVDLTEPESTTMDDENKKYCSPDRTENYTQTSRMLSIRIRDSITSTTKSSIIARKRIISDRTSTSTNICFKENKKYNTNSSVKLRYKLQINQESTECYMYDNPSSENSLFDSHALFKNTTDFKALYNNYEIEKIDSMANFNHFIYKFCSETNPNSLNGCSIKTIPASNGWNVWDISN